MFPWAGYSDLCTGSLAQLSSGEGEGRTDHDIAYHRNHKYHLIRNTHTNQTKHRTPKKLPFSKSPYFPCHDRPKKTIDFFVSHPVIHDTAPVQIPLNALELLTGAGASFSFGFYRFFFLFLETSAPASADYINIYQGC